MKLTIAPLACVLILLGLTGCAIEEVEDQREAGTLYFRAVSAVDHQTTVAGLVEIVGQPARSYSGTEAYLAIGGLPLDSNLVLHFTPANAEDWFPAGDQLLRIPSSVRSDTLSQLLYSRADSLLSVVVRTISGSGERSGMPIWLDGVRWPQDSPARLYFSSLTEHHVRVGDAACTRADSAFSYDVQPSDDTLNVDVGSVTLSVDPGAEGRVILNEESVATGPWSRLDPVMGDHFISAFRPGHVATPAWARLNPLCGGEQTFTWTPGTEGYTTGRIFADFTLDQVVPGQSAPVGQFSLHQTRGRLTLVSFWFIACAACQEEMPGFQALLDEYGHRGFRVIAMDPFPTDDAAFFPDYDFIFLRDVGSPPVAQMAQVSAYPTNFLILPDGTIHSVRGGMPAAVLEALLEELLPE